MTVLVCLDCTTAYAVGARLCPHCGSERQAEQGTAAALGIQTSVPTEHEEENGMGKISRHGGPTTADDLVGEDAPESEGSEDVSAGSSSETSSEKELTSPGKNAASRRKPVRTTGSRSETDPDGSSARGADGGQTGPTPDAGSS